MRFAVGEAVDNEVMLEEGDCASWLGAVEAGRVVCAVQSEYVGPEWRGCEPQGGKEEQRTSSATSILLADERDARPLDRLAAVAIGAQRAVECVVVQLAIGLAVTVRATVRNQHLPNASRATEPKER